MKLKSKLSSLLLTVAVVGIAGFSVTANAGQCPAGMSGTDIKQASVTMPKDVTDTVLTTIDVAHEPAAIAGRSFRMRRLEIKPGGIVPWHSHAERPAIIYVVQGNVTEYSSTCKAPIRHKAGEATPELHNTSHWWKNTGKTTAVLISSDLLKVSDDGKMM